MSAAPAATAPAAAVARSVGDTGSAANSAGVLAPLRHTCSMRSAWQGLPRGATGDARIGPLRLRRHWILGSANPPSSVAGMTTEGDMSFAPRRARVRGVRPEVPGGVDRVALAAGGRAGARRGRDLPRAEPVRAQRGPRGGGVVPRVAPRPPGGGARGGGGGGGGGAG